MNKYGQLILVISLLIFIFSCSEKSRKIENTADSTSKSAISSQDKAYLIMGDKHFINEYPALTKDSMLNVVIEIPTGTLEKWEVEKESGHLSLEKRNGVYRKVNYLGYPGNYGMIPQTLLSKEHGGDGDPLDVLVLGESLERGSIVPCKIIGILKLLDKGEQDDKLIAVAEGHEFFKINTIAELNANFRGVSEIISFWFNNYKGSSKIEIIGFGEKEEAEEILRAAILGYQK